ncbi:MAG: hypothetical protein LQ350_007475 [Teloschistes chrysophthalmus]|nr:MAG: hypothetical protein LQ350_007475 [Niorma chrysophthalma]
MNSTPVKTATTKASIWKGLGEDSFRKHIVGLEKLSEIPGDAKTYSMFEWEQRHPNDAKCQRVLAIDDEQQLADGLSYIAASKLPNKGGKPITAVAVEEHVSAPGLTVRLAANRSMHTKVSEKLQAIFTLLSACAKKGSNSCYTAPNKLLTINTDISEVSCNTSLLPIIIDLARQRIRGRLFPKYRKPPKADPPLHQDLSALLPEFRNNTHISQHVQSLKRLITDYKDVDKAKADNEWAIQKAVESSLSFWTAIATRGRDTVFMPTTDENLTRTVKIIEQVGKVGRYKDVCVSLIKTARRYPGLFANVELEFLPPYMPCFSRISSSGQTVACLVHAEIQLLTFYGLKKLRNSRQPRVLGVSKSACFLCDLFISSHGRFFFSKTHGRLYDTWTMPDLAKYQPDQRQEYRRILQEIDRVCIGLAAQRSIPKRPHPAESSLSVNEYRMYSPMAATTVTHASSQVTVGRLENTGVGEVSSNAFTSEAGEETDRAPPIGTPEPRLLSLRSRNQSQVLLHHSGPNLNDEPFRDIPRATSSFQSPEEIHTRSCQEEAETTPNAPQVNSKKQASSSQSPARLPVDIGGQGISVEDFGPAVKCPVSSLGSSVFAPIQDSALKNSPMHMVTHSGPSPTVLEGLHIYFEAEEPIHGTMAIMSSSCDLQSPVKAVKVDTMTPGEVIDLYRDDAASRMHLSLCRNGHQPVGIELAWL